MSSQVTAREIMIDVFEYPHIPYWFTLRQAAGIVSNTLLAEDKPVHPPVVLVFDEKYNLVGMADIRAILKGLEPLWSAATTPGGKPASDAPIATVMRAAQVFLEPGASVADAARIIVEHGLELVPVLEDRKKLVGVVRWREVFRECSRTAFGA